jgi:hypothetical protein
MPNFHPEFQQEPSEPHQCIWLNSEGVRCRSYALHNQYTCFHHRIDGIKVFSNDAFPIERPVDRDSLQSAIAEVLIRIAANQMDLKRAGILLYGLQVASSNLNGRPIPAGSASGDGPASQTRPEPESDYGPHLPPPSSIPARIPITNAQSRRPPLSRNPQLPNPQR